MLRLILRGIVLVSMMAPRWAPLEAQQRDSVAAKMPPIAAPMLADAKPTASVASPSPRGRFSPPLTPKKAFLFSALLPGYGQSRLDRGTAGALFASVELAAIVMVRRSRMDLREARRYQVTALPDQYVVSGDTLVKNGTFAGRFTADLVRTRRLHVEDWLATVAFNHLFAGADAFVSAQLWDAPVTLSAVPRPSGAVFVATVRF